MKKILVGIALIGAVVLLLNVALYLQQPAMVFFPTKEIVLTPDKLGLRFEEVRIPSTNGNRIHGWYLPKPGAKQVLLFFHGNGGNISYRGDSLLIFNRLGLNVLIIDYQGYGLSEGIPGERTMYQDANVAFDYLQQRGFRQQDIIVFGRSLGGAVAAKLAAERQPGAVILESTFSSARDMAMRLYPALGKYIYLRYHFDSESAVRQIRSPLLMMHSRQDEIIPFASGEKLYEVANKPKMFVEITGDHNNGFLQTQPGYEQVIARFLEIIKR